jgi:two-component system OmpR family sensor kinase
VIRAEATLALDRPRTEEEYRAALAAIDDQAATMEDLVAALLILARAETSSPADMGEIVLADLVSSAVAEVRAAKPKPEVQIDLHVPDDLAVEGSPPLLTRAIRNVVDNAVTVSKPGDTIHVDAVREDGHIALDVQDEGPGIEPDQQDEIFEPFYQVVPARTPGESHGLGLAICRRIVVAHGGTVTVQSAPGQGARFRIVLPEPEENGTAHMVSQLES